MAQRLRHLDYESFCPDTTRVRVSVKTELFFFFYIIKKISKTKKYLQHLEHEAIENKNQDQKNVWPIQRFHSEFLYKNILDGHVMKWNEDFQVRWNRFRHKPLSP